jgi:aldehyde dehydrogenase (NAD+)
MKPNEIVALQKTYFTDGKTRGAQGRKEALAKLRGAILQSESALYDAMQEDLGKSPAMRKNICNSG